MSSTYALPRLKTYSVENTPAKSTKQTEQGGRGKRQCWWMGTGVNLVLTQLRFFTTVVPVAAARSMERFLPFPQDWQQAWAHKMKQGSPWITAEDWLRGRHMINSDQWNIRETSGEEIFPFDRENPEAVFSSLPLDEMYVVSASILWPWGGDCELWRGGWVQEGTELDYWGIGNTLEELSTLWTVRETTVWQEL